MIPREFIGLLLLIVFVTALIVLAVGEREHVACKTGEPFVLIDAIPLYGC